MDGWLEVVWPTVGGVRYGLEQALAGNADWREIWSVTGTGDPVTRTFSLEDTPIDQMLLRLVARPLESGTENRVTATTPAMVARD